MLLFGIQYILAHIETGIRNYSYLHYKFEFLKWLHFDDITLKLAPAQDKFYKSKYFP